MADNKEQLYYVHNGTFIGNNMRWVHSDQMGSSTSLDEAGKFTISECIEISRKHMTLHCINPFPVEHIDENSTRIASIVNVKPSFKIELYEPK